MKAGFDLLDRPLEKRLTIKRVSHVLKEGEELAETLYLKAGSRYAVTTEGWPHIDALTIRLSYQKGETVVPEVDNERGVLFFAPRRTGSYQLRVVIAAIAPGKTSAVVGATVREVLKPCASGTPRERLRKAG